MKREINGRFRKGHSGNPKGRPRKPRRSPVSDRQHKRDILLTMEEEMSLTTMEGKRKKLPIIVVVYKQLLAQAAKGDVRCMCKVIDLRRQLIAEIMNEKLSLLETVQEHEKVRAQYPEDVSDADLWMSALLRKRVFSDEP